VRDEARHEGEGDGDANHARVLLQRIAGRGANARRVHQLRAVGLRLALGWFTGAGRWAARAAGDGLLPQLPRDVLGFYREEGTVKETSRQRCAACGHTLEGHAADGWTCDCSACPWKPEPVPFALSDVEQLEGCSHVDRLRLRATIESSNELLMVLQTILNWDQVCQGAYAPILSAELRSKAIAAIAKSRGK
jgi:hypothetical protein